MKIKEDHPSFFQWALFLIGALFVVQLFLSLQLEKWVHPTPFGSSQGGELEKTIASPLRAAAIISGYKVLVSHIFWIQVIQYYADDRNGADGYSKLYSYCSLATDLDPNFVPVYSYGAAALAYQLHRLNQAVELLKKGIRANPKAIGLKLMLAAIAYHYSQNYAKEIPFLEAQIESGTAPTMLVDILANTYQKVGRLNDAIRLWRHILDTTDSDVQKYQATQKLKKLYAMTRGPISSLPHQP